MVVTEMGVLVFVVRRASFCTMRELMKLAVAPESMSVLMGLSASVLMVI